MRDKLTASKQLLVVSFLLPLFYVWPLFVGNRFYAHTPILSAMGELPQAIDVLCFIGIIVSLVAAGISRTPRLSLGIFLLLSFGFSIWDQSRWMPYFYQYYFMLFVLYGFPWGNDSSTERSRALNTLRLIVFSIWFWSGIHKFNSSFILIGYPWLLEPFLRLLPDGLRPTLLMTAFLCPWVEAGGALLLLIPKTRLAGISLITSMHLLILLLLGPFGKSWNPSVWWWNVAMIIFAWLLFYRETARPWEILLGTPGRFSERLKHRMILLLFLLLPGLNYFGCWDDLLSHSLYSWSTLKADILLKQNSEELLPQEARSQVKEVDSIRTLSVNDWAFNAYQSSPYSSYRVFWSLFEKICETTSGDSRITLRIYKRPIWNQWKRETSNYRCAPELGRGKTEELIEK